MPQSKHNTKITCSVGHAISIKASNLTIVPCHRMAYPYFEAAQFVYDNKNEKITKVQIKNNVDAYYAMTNGNHLMNPKCAACEYNYFCIKGCLGSQYETFGDYNIPIPNICELMQAKTDFLFKKYHDTGLFKIYFENLQEFADGKYNEASRYLEFLLYKGYKEYERYAKNS
jgi:radical SAM protein with 4Fe4S-binding SPASM domain